MNMTNPQKKVYLYCIIEIVQYAIYLGLDPTKDADLMWIAREGFSAPVPEPWEQRTNKEGETCYYNKATKELVWEHPLDDEYKEKWKIAKAKKLGNIKIEKTEENFEVRKDRVIDVEDYDDADNKNEEINDCNEDDIEADNEVANILSKAFENDNNEHKNKYQREINVLYWICVDDWCWVFKKTWGIWGRTK